jgi:DHA1 family tetracycline resistance protein-like MFS transporter
MSQPPKSRALLFIVATLILDIMGLGIIIPITPRLVATFVGGDLSHASRYFGLLVALYALMQFLFAPMLGALSDRFGRKPILLFSLFGQALAYLMTAFAPNLGWIFAARALGGVASGSATVASAYIADVSTPQTRAQNFGLMGAAFGIGFILGPALGGMLGNHSLQLPFLVAAGVSLLNGLYGLLFVPESHHPENRQAFAWTKANPLAFFTMIRKYPLVTAMAGSLLAVGLAQQCQQSNWVLYTTMRFHWSPTQNGLSLTLVGVCMAIVQGGLIRVILPKLGERRTIIYGMLGWAVSMILFGLATQGWWMIVLIMASSVTGIAGPAVQALISRQVGPEEQGALQGSITGLMSLTGIAGPIMANQLFALFTAPSAPIHLPGIAFFLGALLIVLGLLNMLRVFSLEATRASGSAIAAQLEPVE